MTRVCVQDGCSKPMKARGLCNTHYNQTLPNRHRKITVPCDYCGTGCTKYAAARRYVGQFCSLACRDYMRTGIGDTCRIPTDHWARMYGATCEWTAPAPDRASFQQGVCGDCGVGIIEPATQTPSTYCSDRCVRRSAKRRRRAREHNAPGEYRWVDVMRQYRKQGYTCAYCMQPCTGLPDPEHVMPLSRGGRNDMSNLVAACRACNTDKNDLTLDEWKQDRLRRGLTPLRTTLTGSAYKHLMPTLPTRPAWRHLAA